MKLKETLIALTILLLASNQLLAHYLWVETSAEGKIGKEQTVKVFFGEYTNGEVETAGEENYNTVKDFEVWVVNPNGDKEALTFEAKGDHYASSFTPQQAGTYSVILNNDNIDVLDYTKYDFGIFKTHYHSLAKVIVKGKNDTTVADNVKGLSLIDMSEPLEQNGVVKLQVLYKGKVLPEYEVAVFVADQWNKKLTTDEEGMVSFSLPWETKYIVEVIKNEDVPGVYKGDDYEFIYHCVTFCADLTK